MLSSQRLLNSSFTSIRGSSTLLRWMSEWCNKSQTSLHLLRPENLLGLNRSIKQESLGKRYPNWNAGRWETAGRNLQEDSQKQYRTNGGQTAGAYQEDPRQSASNQGKPNQGPLINGD